MKHYDQLLCYNRQLQNQQMTNQITCSFAGIIEQYWNQSTIHQRVSKPQKMKKNIKRWQELIKNNWTIEKIKYEDNNVQQINSLLSGIAQNKPEMSFRNYYMISNLNFAWSIYKETSLTLNLHDQYRSYQLRKRSLQHRMKVKFLEQEDIINLCWSEVYDPETNQIILRSQLEKEVKIQIGIIVGEGQLELQWVIRSFFVPFGSKKIEKNYMLHLVQWIMKNYGENRVFHALLKILNYYRQILWLTNINGFIKQKSLKYESFDCFSYLLKAIKNQKMYSLVNCQIQLRQFLIIGFKLQTFRFRIKFIDDLSFLVINQIRESDIQFSAQINAKLLLEISLADLINQILNQQQILYSISMHNKSLLNWPLIINVFGILLFSSKYKDQTSLPIRVKNSLLKQRNLYCIISIEQPIILVIHNKIQILQKHNLGIDQMLFGLTNRIIEQHIRLFISLYQSNEQIQALTMTCQEQFIIYQNKILSLDYQKILTNVMYNRHKQIGAKQIIEQSVYLIVKVHREFQNVEFYSNFGRFSYRKIQEQLNSSQWNKYIRTHKVYGAYYNPIQIFEIISNFQYLKNYVTTKCNMLLDQLNEQQCEDQKNKQ